MLFQSPRRTQGPACPVSSRHRVARPRSGLCRVLRDILNVKALVGVFYREKGLLSDCENFANGSFAALIFNHTKDQNLSTARSQNTFKNAQTLYRPCSIRKCNTGDSFEPS